MFNFARAARSLEQAAESAGRTSSERIVASHLGKAERLILKSRLNLNEVSALILLYDRVLLAADHLTGTIPIQENCEQMKAILRGYAS
jgi:hypothetical protein